MPRRATKRRRRRAALVILVLVIGGVVAGTYIWRTMQPPHAVPTGTASPSHVQPPNAAVAPSGEDFSAAERQGLEEVLKHRGAGKQP